MGGANSKGGVIFNDANEQSPAKFETVHDILICKWTARFSNLNQTGGRMGYQEDKCKWAICKLDGDAKNATKCSQLLDGIQHKQVNQLNWINQRPISAVGLSQSNSLTKDQFL